ncbi:TetR/AcrR family transcriptional regulator [Bizionia paragorgiae]|uniref:TetR/AcrR family transcriptional regulator n=1 Tax=Bizionia paragorgiae TaxID=283786 RepID=UPI00299E00EA|nr:TetR/AcrR family transcriptional regulator [Bizionia paragorgiae]MDX1271389.1 TetR/AcrR family transcriptional regulator [Bizionia paragorgiae]
MKQQNRKEEIVEAAAKLFKKKGYSAVTMRDLATELGMKAASLYNHINSKQELLNSIILSIAEQFTEEMSNIKNSNSPTAQKLTDIVELHIKLASENTYGMASLNNDWMHLGDQLQHYLTLRNGYEDDFRDIIKKGIENKEIVNENPEIILFSMLTTLRSLYLWIPKKENLDINSLSKSLSQILIQGIDA